MSKTVSTMKKKAFLVAYVSLAALIGFLVLTGCTRLGSLRGSSQYTIDNLLIDREDRKSVV